MAELQIRTEELGTLKDRVDAVGASVAKAVSEGLNPDPRR